MNTEEFKWGVNWQQVLKSLIEDHQDVEDEEAKQVGIIISYFPAEHAQFLYSRRYINMYSITAGFGQNNHSILSVNKCKQS